MIKLAHWILTIAIILLGAIHCFIAFYCRILDKDTLWFLGAGIAIIFAGLFNAIFLQVDVRPIKAITILVNIIMTSLFIFASQVMSGSQVYIGITLFAMVTILMFCHQQSPQQ